MNDVKLNLILIAPIPYSSELRGFSYLRLYSLLRIKDKYGYGIEQFFLTEEKNVDYERAIKIIQNRIDDGFMWIVGEGKKSGNTEHRFINHPYAS